MRSIAVSLVLVLTVATAHASEMLKPGDAFPTWKLVDHTGAPVTSQSLAGRAYLLWFYPRAQTPGCTAEGNGLRDQFPAFQARDVEILGVSFDAPAANAAFVRAQDFPFRLLSDQDKTLADAVGASGTLGLYAKRISYLVGPDGKVLKAYAEVTPATHAREVLQDVGTPPAAASPPAP